MFLYTRPSDNLLLGATLSVNTGTEDVAYPKANIHDLSAERPAKLTSTTGSWVADLGSAKRVDLTAIIHANLAAGLDVKIQGNATNTWGAPTVSQAFTIPARYADSFPVNVWLDLKTLIPNDGTRTQRYWRLLVNTANSAPIAVGEWRLENTRRDLGVRNISWGSTRSWRRPAVLHETELLVRRSYDLGTMVRTVEVETVATDVTLAEIDTWFRGALGIVKPFVIVPHSDENDAWMVGFTNPERPYVRRTRNVNTVTLEFQEFSRGLYP